MFFPISLFVNAEFPENIENEELNSLLSTIKNQGEENRESTERIR